MGKIPIKFYLYGGAFLLLIALVGYATTEHMIAKKEKAERIRLQENQRQYLQDSLKYAKLTLSLGEFKQTMSAKIDRVLDSIRIKPKQVTSVIERHYYYHNSDTLVYKPNEVITDSGSIFPFNDLKDCFHFAGFMQLRKSKPQLIVTQREFNNNSTDIAYLERPHHFLFIKWGKWRAKLISTHQCGQETTKDIEIIKK